MYNDQNWNTLKQFFPDKWEEKLREFGVINRERKMTPETLVRLLFMHLADGCSLRETSARGKEAQLACVSDVALYKKLKASSEWFRWFAVSLLDKLGIPSEKPEWLSKYNVRAVDASVISEPGSTGSDWRLHYCMQIFGLTCDHIEVTSNKKGESFKNFKINKGDLMIGDRIYGSASGISYILENEGDFLVRIKNRAMKFKTSDGHDFNLLETFKKLEIGEIGDFDVKFNYKGEKWKKIRLCVIKKTPENALYSIKKVKQEMLKKQHKISEETLELHNYFFVITSVKRRYLSVEQILSLYKLRWQIELAFKRLKSILGLGHLPKFDPQSAIAWLHGKLAIAILSNLIIDKGRFFSPWGYPIR